MQHPKDESTHKRISTTYSINYISNIIATGLYQFFTIVKHTTPCIVVGIDGAPECNYHLLTTREPFHHLLANTQETALIYITIGFGCIKILGLNAKDLFAIFFITKYNVRTSNHLGHYLCSSLTILPKITTIVDVATYCYSQFIGGLDSF